ncbi:hypothetical protein I601_0995 [Nocardioides dokdonensis FR1436]|uniref:Uncharacterized protein n=1 Tax=Nocardioides dokdonensis FR1436 TaxID=1300347 RepID=A0A1A9GGL5_9ACTN|nr:hypothetical protein [Nocardioides dokdonensis]ANH37437.1 hypothetical protein I601_0995 [Nocardioides dokdonensis FR1436]
MSKRRFVLHVGLEHSGADGLAVGLAEHRDRLAELGVRCPARHPDESRRAAIELRRLHKSWGYHRREVEGAWADLVRRARKQGATAHAAVVVSEELLAGASPDQIALLLDSLGGFEVHVVVTLHDPASQLVDAWAASVRCGGSLPLRRYARRVLDPGRETVEAGDFWAAHDVGPVLERWAGALRRSDRVHVVVPTPGQDRTESTWRVVAALAGVEADAVAMRDPERSTLGPAGLKVLRHVNRAVDERARVHAARAVLHDQLRARVPGSAAGLSSSWHEDLVDLAEAWAKALAEGGYDVTGATADLAPPSPWATGTPYAAGSSSTEERLTAATDALADLLVETTRLREHAGDLEARVEKLTRKKASLKARLATAVAAS